MLKGWDWEDTGKAMALVFLLFAFGTVGAFILAPKNVDYYYLSHGSQTSGQASVCVYAHWTWHNDEISFCTDDQQKALDFVAKANAGMHK